MPIRSHRRILVWAATVALLGACASTGAPPPPPLPTAQPYRVGPPDQLEIHVLPEPVIERTVVVRPDGMISIDLVGDIPASGRTTEEIAGDIKRRIQRFKRDASVTVSLRQSLSTEITVLGEVSRPATFPLTRETRVVEAIGLVGGPRLFAAKTRIRVIRFEDGQTRVYQTDLRAIERGDLSSNYLLVPGDIVVVPPTRVASVGYTLSALFFPINQLFGTGARATTTVMTGGASRAAGF
jgi:polysaccharide biosynthesis/export protein